MKGVIITVVIVVVSLGFYLGNGMKNTIEARNIAIAKAAVIDQ